MKEKPNPGEHFPEHAKPPEGLSPEARARYTVWQPRYEEFRPHFTTWRTRANNGPYTGPQFEWMTSENLGDYLLFRFDMIDRAGGMEFEKEWEKERHAKNKLSYMSADDMIASRLLEVGREISVWGHSIETDLIATYNHFVHQTFHPTLTSQSKILIDILKPRRDQYEDTILTNVGVELKTILNNEKPR